MGRMPAAKRREQLLDVAADLFARGGYARATTSELAKSAGVTEPIIYRHFKSKRDLFVALIERTGHETLAQWEKDVADAVDPAQRLRALISDNPMVSERGRKAYRVLLQATTEVEDPKILTALTDHMQKLHAFLSREIATAQESKKVVDRFSPEMIAWLLMDIGLGYGVLKAMGMTDQRRDSEGMHVQDVIKQILVGSD